MSVIAKVKNPAPKFAADAVVDGQFKRISLDDYKGKWVVLFFYPLDFTFVYVPDNPCCPTEIIAFSERSPEFKALNVEVIGASVDSKYSHLAWINQPRKTGGLGEMKIPLIADLSKKISKDYGVLIEDGPDAGIALRGTFIIDPKGILRQATINDLPIGRSVDEVLRLIEALQFHEEHGEVCPVNWKKGAKTMKDTPTESKAYFNTVYDNIEHHRSMQRDMQPTDLKARESRIQMILKGDGQFYFSFRKRVIVPFCGTGLSESDFYPRTLYRRYQHTLLLDEAYYAGHQIMIYLINQPEAKSLGSKRNTIPIQVEEEAIPILRDYGVQVEDFEKRTITRVRGIFLVDPNGIIQRITMDTFPYSDINYLLSELKLLDLKDDEAFRVHNGVIVRPDFEKLAPNFTADAVHDGEFTEITLADYAGKWVILLFYALNFTFVCPTEIIAFSERSPEFNALNVEILAISVESQYSHLQWVSQPRRNGGLGDIRIPLVSDLTRKITTDYGVLNEVGPLKGSALRSTFIIDPNGIVRNANVLDIAVGRNVDEVLRLVQALQHYDEHGRACPVNWRKGGKTISINPAESKSYFREKPAPSFVADAVVNGEFSKISFPNDYKGKWAVLFFYPLDFTFVCPTEIIAYSERSDEFKDLGAELIGASVDSKYSHLAWINQPRKDGGLGTMKIPLISDITKQISRDYGVLVEDGPDAGVALRGTFIVDPNGILRQITINDLPIGRSVDETLRLLEALKFNDEFGEVCPIGWKKGDRAMKSTPAESKAYFRAVYDIGVAAFMDSQSLSYSKFNNRKSKTVDAVQRQSIVLSTKTLGTIESTSGSRFAIGQNSSAPEKQFDQNFVGPSLIGKPPLVSTQKTNAQQPIAWAQRVAKAVDLSDLDALNGADSEKSGKKEVFELETLKALVPKSTAISAVASTTSKRAAPIKTVKPSNSNAIFVESVNGSGNSKSNVVSKSVHVVGKDSRGESGSVNSLSQRKRFQRNVSSVDDTRKSSISPEPFIFDPKVVVDQDDCPPNVFDSAWDDDKSEITSASTSTWHGEISLSSVSDDEVKDSWDDSDDESGSLDTAVMRDSPELKSCSENEEYCATPKPLSCLSSGAITIEKGDGVGECNEENYEEIFPLSVSMEREEEFLRSWGWNKEFYCDKGNRSKFLLTKEEIESWEKANM
ncbi:hypothetical protein HK098_008089 [Nowakowskiella sp. JEL0407]|nr:hypothetical protein HK098_008089 [Nowakowskiella sp. JEL0407]